MVSARVLVTGARGFIGSHLSARLVADGWEVHGTTRRAFAEPGGAVRHHVADLSDLRAARSLLQEVRPQVVVHLAGFVSGTPDRTTLLPTFTSHVTSAVNLLALTAELDIGRLLLTGTSLEAEGVAEAVPSSPYAAAKAAAVSYAQMAWALWGTPVTVLRPHMTYGSGQSPSKVLPYVIETLAAGDTPVLSNSGWLADWVHVDDVVDGYVRAAQLPGVEGEEIDLGSGHLTSVGDVAARVASLMGAEALPLSVPKGDRPGAPQRGADLDPAARRLGWAPRISLEEGLQRTIADADRRRAAVLSRTGHLSR